MDNPALTSPGLTPLMREALDWIVRLTSGFATEADKQECDRWREQSPAHAAAFQEAVRMRKRLRIGARHLAARAGDRSGHESGSSRLSRRAFVGGALAASAAGWLAVRPPFHLWPSVGDLASTLRADYTTAPGEQRQVPLAFGDAYLNTQTRIALRTIDGVTGVDLLSGEALFAPSDESNVPFFVVAGPAVVHANHGSFNVRNEGDEIRVTCIDGDIQVRSDSVTTALRSAQQITYGPQGQGRVVSVDTRQTTSWRAGLLIFRDQSVNEVIDEINRYRRGKIILANSSLGDRQVSGTFHLRQLDGVLAQLQQLLGARATSLPGGIVVLT